MITIIKNLKTHLFLLQQLIIRDFKVKYKRSTLGVLWSVLYPLLMMAVMAVVFSNMFKMTMPNVNYLVYLLTGLVVFNYFSDATNQSLTCIIGNFSLINKIYIPKYIFPISKVLFSTINFLITLIPLYIVIIFTGTTLHINHVFLIYIIICVFLFSLGISFIVSAISVFVRDLIYLWGIVILVWTYLTPIMYDVAIIPQKYMLLFKLNPLYQFIDYTRTIILFQRIPSVESFIVCGLWGIIVSLVGAFIFKKTQDKFIYYI